MGEARRRQAFAAVQQLEAAQRQQALLAPVQAADGRFKQVEQRCGILDAALDAIKWLKLMDGFQDLEPGLRQAIGEEFAKLVRDRLDAQLDRVYATIDLFHAVEALERATATEPADPQPEATPAAGATE